MTPAACRLSVSDWIGPEKVSAADCGPIWVTMSVSCCVVVSGSPKSPTIETSAISAGNSDSRP